MYLNFKIYSSKYLKIISLLLCNCSPIILCLHKIKWHRPNLELALFVAVPDAFPTLWCREWPKWSTLYSRSFCTSQRTWKDRGVECTTSETIHSVLVRSWNTRIDRQQWSSSIESIHPVCPKWPVESLNTCVRSSGSISFPAVFDTDSIKATTCCLLGISFHPCAVQ